MMPFTVMTRWSGCILDPAAVAASSKTSTPPLTYSASTFLSFFDLCPKHPLLNFLIKSILPLSSTHNSLKPSFFLVFRVNLKLKSTTGQENLGTDEMGFGFGVACRKGILLMAIIREGSIKRENHEKFRERKRE